MKRINLLFILIIFASTSEAQSFKEKKSNNSFSTEVFIGGVINLDNEFGYSYGTKLNYLYKNNKFYLGVNSITSNKETTLTIFQDNTFEEYQIKEVYNNISVGYAYNILKSDNSKIYIGTGIIYSKWTEYSVPILDPWKEYITGLEFNLQATSMLSKNIGLSLTTNAMVFDLSRTYININLGVFIKI